MKLVFDEKEHRYWINGTPVPGCTSVTGILPQPWAMPWVAKETINHVLNALGSKTSIELSPLLEILFAAKGAAKRKADEGAAIGSIAHQYMELYIRDKLGLELFPPELPKDLRARNSVELFRRWEFKTNPEWLETEVIVGSEKHMYAGKYDVTARINGVVTLIDFKTSNDIHKEYSYQLSGYLNAYEEMGKEPKIEQRMVLWLPKEGDVYEDRIIRTPHEQDLRVFLDALALYKSLKESDQLIKEIEK